MDCTKEVAEIFIARFKQLDLAVKEDDLSKASFPLTGEFARLELLSKRDTIMWVLEMLNISDEDVNPVDDLSKNQEEVTYQFLMENATLVETSYSLHLWEEIYNSEGKYFKVMGTIARNDDYVEITHIDYQE